MLKQAELAYRERVRLLDSLKAAAAAHAREAFGYDHVHTVDCRDRGDRVWVLLQGSYMANEACRFAVVMTRDGRVLRDDAEEEEYRA